ncbi:MAG: methyltransferase domain-containing protein [Methylacidiphilales bacterium]|nr:methyltransferase domain-containing protein [Candidatus Methylacidiphilales bacterium]NJR18625.1 methyltransferase domain-containing protein [Calothrix sp. CSU_2_0]
MKSQAAITQKSNSLNQGICLHVGCGLNVVEGWENIDASPSLRIAQIPVIGRSILAMSGGPKWSQNVSYGDIIQGLNKKDNTCQLIFAAHVLEHLSLTDFQTALANIFKYLKPEGIFRFIVPDLKQYIDSYIQQYNDSSLSPIAAQQFLQESLVGCSTSRKDIYLRLREALSNSRHQWMWDEPSLIHALSQQGFKQVRRCEYGDWSDTRFSGVEKKENYLQAIGIEAIK